MICPDCEGGGMLEETTGGVNENGPYLFTDEIECCYCDGSGEILSQEEHDELFYERVRSLGVLELLEKPPDSKLH